MSRCMPIVANYRVSAFIRQWRRELLGMDQMKAAEHYGVTIPKPSAFNASRTETSSSSALNRWTGGRSSLALGTMKS